MIEKWERFLEDIYKEIDKDTFETWFNYVKPVSMNNKALTLEVPNNFYKNWIIDNYSELINKTVLNIYGEKFSIIFTIKDHKEETDHNKAKADHHTYSLVKKKQTHSSCPCKPNSRYTFNNFVIGPSNQFAHAASTAVAKQPAKAYNPLFIYGGVGLGKTHLLNSIGNYIINKTPETNVCYISSEHFVNDLIDSIQHKKMTAFRNKYRDVDVLMIDDIQFISGKDRTQVEFFHTFNTLYESHKQIIISSDRIPKEMINLEERLRSRFEWGLITDIQPPDLETKVAILKQRAEANNFKLPSDVAIFIASKVKSNVRELEGCLARVSAFSSITGKDITITLAKDILKDLIYGMEKMIDIKTIQEAVATYFNIKVSDLKSKKRDKNIVVPRQISMYLCRRLTNISLPEIGKNFGGKDHTTVLHSDTKIHDIITKDPNNEIYKNVMNITKGLNCEFPC